MLFRSDDLGFVETTSTISTSSEASSSHIPESAQVVSTHPGSSTVVETESSQLPVVTIHPISDTIPPGPDVVQPEVDPDPVSFFPEHLHPEVELSEVVPKLVIPHSIISIESPISHSQPPEIYFGPDGEILPPGLISIKEIPQYETPLTTTHFGEHIYLYESFPQSPPSSFVDPVPIQNLVDSKGYTFGQVTMPEPTSSVGTSIPITSVPALATPSLFTTSPE